MKSGLSLSNSSLSNSSSPNSSLPKLTGSRSAAHSGPHADAHIDAKRHTAPCQQDERDARTQWYGLFDCDDNELVFAPAPSRIKGRLWQRLSHRLNRYPQFKRRAKWIIRSLVSPVISHIIYMFIYVPLHYWRILWFGRKNAAPPPKVIIPLNIEPWTGRILPHPRKCTRDCKSKCTREYTREDADKNPITKGADLISWMLSSPDTRYVTYAWRMKRRRESLLAWHCHRIHSILRGTAPATPRYLMEAECPPHNVTQPDTTRQDTTRPDIERQDIKRKDGGTSR